MAFPCGYVDIVDINMPDLSGMDFVKSLSNAPRVIFTTAYSEYALEGFKVDEVDYLLKPIGYGEFLKAAEKATTRIQPKEFLPPKFMVTISFCLSNQNIKYCVSTCPK